ncbi:MAG TPA: hypothetical protein VNP97_01930 [Microbacterium sp.]|nr:hypothetical protein [Microbacterium sp.]
MPVPRQIRHALSRALAVAAACTLAVFGVVVVSAPAHAASHGVGFGTWAPVSPYGWHGSMVIDGVHTYCILPGAPAPTGTSIDHGTSASAAGLSPQQLTGINLLVTKYGQTNDPVQAAAVGWAVKAIANWDETLHHFGYRGDSLAGAIHWTFSALAPEHNQSVQERAVAYYDEARGVAAGMSSASGTMVFTTDAADHRLGTVRVEATTAAASGVLTLVNATFAATGTTALTGAVPGIDYPIVTDPPAPGRAYTVSGTGHFSLGPVAAVRHYTTPGGQDTAGPPGEIGFDVAGADAAPRVPLFHPTISTQVASKYAAGGPFVDEVVFGGSTEHWPRSEDGAYLPVAATAEVYRTDVEPTLVDATAAPEAAVPPDAVHVGSLALTTDPEAGPTIAYNVISSWTLDEPGFYTAVWTVRQDSQSTEVARHLRTGYAWVEAFGEKSQVVMVPTVSSLAVPTVIVGDAMSDTILVGAPLPADGLVVSSAVYRAREGVAPQDVCVEENLVWASEPHLVTAPGELSVTSPIATEPGTYFWQERAVDAAGELVHLGACGVAHETTRVVASIPDVPTPQPPALAATGLPADSARGIAGFAVVLLTVGATLSAFIRRRRFVARAPIG